MGTVNSSLTLRPSARCCWAYRRWCASDGRRPQMRHGCLATNLTRYLSRKRRGSEWAKRLLSTLCGNGRIDNVRIGGPSEGFQPGLERVFDLARIDDREAVLGARNPVRPDCSVLG